MRNEERLLVAIYQPVTTAINVKHSGFLELDLFRVGEILHYYMLDYGIISSSTLLKCSFMDFEV
jgi:hypothetical protein